MSHPLQHDLEKLIDLIAEKPAARAFIREAECIGCVKCLEACPFDAIVGAQKKMHTVVESHCTGCELCVEPCPVDCIEIIAVDRSALDTTSLIDDSRVRFRLKKERITDYHQERNKRYEAAKKAFQPSGNDDAVRAARQREIAAAINRVKNKTT